MNSDKCIIFDMDGVLINSEPIHFRFESLLFKSLGIDISREEHEKFVGTTSKTLWTTIKNNHNLPFTVSELIEKGHSGLLTYLDTINPLQLISGIPELLLKLKEAGFILALASSSPRKHIDYILTKGNINKIFPVQISGDDVENGKPDPEIFLLAAKKSLKEPGNCLVIEDSKNGVNAANKAGMKCIGFKNPGSGMQDLSSADLIIDSFQKFNMAILDSLFYK
jgi:HAD superfamily hydrolase (TIGR01509 family)